MGKNSESRRKYSQVLVILAALVSLVFGGRAADAASFLNSCTTFCHGMPPQDFARKGNPHFDSQSSSFIGNHKNHLPAVPGASDCSICHAPVAATAFNHQNNTIEMAGTGSIKGGSYTKGVFINQTSIPALTNATCSSVSCHFERLTPNWGTNQSTTTCATCHDASPTTLAHSKHLSTSLASIACAGCHSNHSAEAKPFAHATSAGRTIAVTAGSYAGSNNNYLPSQAATRSVGSCTTAYCHSSGNINNAGSAVPPTTFKTISWSAASIGCSGCHGDGLTNGKAHPIHPSGAAASATANSHVKHVENNLLSCDFCHVTTTTNATIPPTSVIAGGSHLNGIDDVSFKSNGGKTGIYSAAAKTCSATFCHGDGPSPAWGGTALNCQDCHGNGASASVADFSGNFWNNGTISKFQMTGTGSWAGNGHGLTVGNYASGLPAANFGGADPCQFCHDSAVAHNVSSNAFRLANYSTAAYGRNAPCLICHSATGGGVLFPSAKNRTTSGAVEADHFGAKHGPSNNGGQFCWDCHDPHGNGSTNLYMIRSNPAKVSDRATGAPTTQTATAVVFTARDTGADFAVSASPFNGVCNVCHSTASHYTATAGDGHNSTTTCVSCHSHSGSAHGSDAFAQAGGGCNGCHDYDTGGTYAGGVWSGGTWGKAGSNFGGYVVPEGYGAHAKHINYIKTRLGITSALSPDSQTFGTNQPGQVCGTCHTNNAANHNMSGTSGSDTSGRLINFGDGAFKLGGATGTTSLIFGGTPTPLYDGVSGTSSATAAKTCSNVSCHYFTTVLWSTY